MLSCYYLVHVVFTPCAFLCASDAVSKVELIVAHAKLGLIADWFVFSLVDQRLDQQMDGG